VLRRVIGWLVKPCEAELLQLRRRRSCGVAPSSLAAASGSPWAAGSEKAPSDEKFQGWTNEPEYTRRAAGTVLNSLHPHIESLPTSQSGLRRRALG
jgi:hypothetical protein